MPYSLVQKNHVCIYNLCILYSNDNIGHICNYILLVYVHTCAYMQACVFGAYVYKIIFTEALCMDFIPILLLRTQDLQARGAHGHLPRLRSELPSNTVAVFVEYVLTVASKPVVKTEIFKSSLCSGSLSRQNIRTTPGFLFLLLLGRYLVISRT